MMNIRSRNSSQNHSGCNHSDIRLVDGQNSNEGRVEICIDGVWGSVCDDNWDYKDASVACRQLGLEPTCKLLL